jgi:hypothetical protein
MMRTRILGVLVLLVSIVAPGCGSDEPGFLLERDAMVSGAEKLAAASVPVGVATYTPDGIDRTRVGTIAYRKDASLDLYYPPDFVLDAPLPTVVVVNGFSTVDETLLIRPDGAIETLPAVDFRRSDSFISLANTLAASGMLAVVYGTTDDPPGDLDDAMDWLLDNADGLLIDRDHVALWMFSAHTLVGLRGAMDRDRDWAKHLAGAVVFYGWMPVDEFRTDLPVLAVKALRDDVFFVESMDDYVARAAVAGAPVEYHEVDGPHSFDFDPDSTAVSDPMVERALAFIREA